MINYTFNRPDPDALNHLLSGEYNSAGGVILRLAWYLGLMRGEIRTLSWSQIDFDAAMVRLPSRNVPIPLGMLSYLKQLKANQAVGACYVAASDKGRPFAEQYISKLAREALDRAGQKNVRLIDLRHDYLVQQLREHDWQYVSQISGIGLVSLRDHFMSHVKAVKHSQQSASADLPPIIDVEKVARLIRSEQFSPAGTLICLSGMVGLLVSEMQNLTWRQVDFTNAFITFPDRTVPIPADAFQYLVKLKEYSGGRSDYVVVSRRAGKPLEAAYISKTARATLVSAGIPDVTLSDLRLDFIRRTQVEPPILSLTKERGNITRADVAELLSATRAQAYTRLNHMVASGKLVRVGSRYFLPEQTTPPERHTELILDYLGKEGSAVRQDFARLLNILPRQVYPILQKLVSSGDVVFRGGRYYLPGQE